MRENGKVSYQESLNSAENRWYAFHTRARHEKRVNERLQDRGVEVFLPLVPRSRQWHDRKKIVEMPLFPSYVFARAAEGSLVRVLDTPGVAGVVRMAGRAVPVAEEEIENVRRFAAVIVETGNVPEPEPFFDEGQPVRITSGQLSGVEGLIVERRGGNRALLQVGLKAIGQGLKVEVDQATLQVISNGRLEWQ